MGLSRVVLRAEAKKLYKEQTKGVPRKQRVPFATFFKNYKELKSGKIKEADLPATEEDFDFESMINVIDDDDLVDETAEETDDQDSE